MMSKITSWLCEPMSTAVARRIERIAADEDVVQVAVMPDVHLAGDFCVGTVVATNSRIFPAAIGGDIGCGMAAIRVQGDANLIDERSAESLLKMLRRFVPPNRHSRDTMADSVPPSLLDHSLSDKRLEKMVHREGRVQLGTLGRGNHFLEFQRDAEGGLWVMLHTGSRAMGQAINAAHLPNASNDSGLRYFTDSSECGRRYLNDVSWAMRYATENRMAILRMVEEIFDTMFGVGLDFETLVETDHNHVRREIHDGNPVWVHRKGAQSAADGLAAIIPGSMGTSSYHVVGRGCGPSLCSSSHGAGRRLSRSMARSQTTDKEVRRQLSKVFYDSRMLRAMREESPTAYKDIRRVMKPSGSL